MASEFSRVLSLLRKEKRESQRSVAEALGISQSLLSHYEKGAREPGLAFVAKAAEYYGVSCDYLMGRTMLRERAQVSEDALMSASGAKDNKLTGNVMSQLHKKLLQNGVGFLVDLVGKTNSRELTEAVASYLGDSIYFLFRQIYDVTGENGGDFFSIPQELFAPLARADMARSESKMASVLHGLDQDKRSRKNWPPLSHAQLMQENPLMAQCLFMVLQQAGQRIMKSGGENA